MKYTIVTGVQAPAAVQRVTLTRQVRERASGS